MGNKNSTTRHYCNFCGKKKIHHTKPCVKKSKKDKLKETLS